MCAMSDDLQRADPEVVETLIEAMTLALRNTVPFTPSDGISAGLTMAMRLSRSIIELSEGPEAKHNNAARAAGVLRSMACELEMEYMDPQTKVH